MAECPKEVGWGSMPHSDTWLWPVECSSISGLAAADDDDDDDRCIVSSGDPSSKLMKDPETTAFAPSGLAERFL